MRISSTVVTATILLASEAYAGMFSPAKHHGLARRVQRQKRCAARLHQTASSSSTNNNNNNGNFNVNNVQVQTSNPPQSTAPPSPPPQLQGVIQIADGPCGPSGATPDTSALTGPNGSIDFLNCGIEGSGWNPPPITFQNVIFKDLRTVLSWDNSVFAPCAPYIDAFEQVAASTGVPAILLASIAMQESTCQPYVTGKNGEVGMMQITPDKCVGDCYEPWNNINIGGTYFMNVYNSVQNLPLACGQYNGWFAQMTEYDANNKCCSCRNNLDYIHNVLNGFMQGISPESRGMGKYFNLQSC